MTETLTQAIVGTAVNPRPAARIVLGWGLGWNFVFLVSAAAIVMTMIQIAALGAFANTQDLPEGAVSPQISLNTFLFLLAQFAGSVMIIYVVGRLFGGKGTILTLAMVVGWTGFVQGVLLLAAVLLTLLIPLVGGMLTFGIAIWSIWILFSFIAEAHGFESTWRVIGVAFGLSTVLAILLVLAGYGPVILGELPDVQS